jgi:chromosome segregation ATPase
MVTIRSLSEELKSLGLVAESAPAVSETPAKAAPVVDAAKVLARKQEARKMRTRIEGLKDGFATKAAVVESKEPKAEANKTRIQSLFEELETLTQESVEAPSAKASRIMGDVLEIAQAIMKKYGSHEEVKEVFEALTGAAQALNGRLTEMQASDTEREVKKVVAELVESLEWLLEEFEEVKKLPLQGEKAKPDDRSGKGGEPGGTEKLPAQVGAGSPVGDKPKAEKA